MCRFDPPKRTGQGTKKRPEPKGQAEAVKQVEAKLKRLERELADASKAKDEITAKFQASRRDAELAKAIAAHEFVEPAFVSRALAQQIRFEGDDLLFETDDGKLVSVVDGVAGFAAAKPALIKAKGAGGSGHMPNAGSGNGKQSMTSAEFQALTPMQRMEASKTGVQITE